jgi:D-serine deaminase-like pyridoxal phosphate-dependent protein
MPAPWYAVENVNEIESPSLLVYPDRIRENLRRMIALAGDIDRLRPHVKTHKMPEIIRMQLAAGIRRFKVATIAEAEMVADCGAPDVLLAYQPVGPNPRRLARLMATRPETRFSTIVDDPDTARALDAAMQAAGQRIETLIDLDVGMGRTGVAPGPQAVELYRTIAELAHLRPGGLHVYDGQARDRELADRTKTAEAAFAPAARLRAELEAAGLPVPRVVAGGTPTFPIHARHADRECSPGTCVLWDASYAGKFPDLEFLPAAVLLTRAISKPGANRLCMDLGYKAVASDNPDPRAVFLELPDAKMLVHSEEHMAIGTEQAARFNVGDVTYAIPFHVCPTCALHREAVVIENHRAVDRWPIVARDRVLTA